MYTSYNNIMKLINERAGMGILINTDLVNQAINTIRKYSMLKGPETVLVGLSGGPDSVCLLTVMHRIKDAFDLKIHAVYVDHNLRPEETPAEISFCRELCGKVNADFRVKSVDVSGYAKEHHMNKQEAARALRYKAFYEAALEAGADKIALAHNADDQTETIFMRLLRGAGPSGLAGIPAKRGAVIRPLIETERRDIEDYLQRENIRYVIDSSNLQTDYFRNRFRMTIVPELKKLNPSLVQSVNRTASILQEEERYLDIIVTKTLMKMISRKTERRIELFLSPMEAMDIVILRRVLRRALEATEGLRGIGFIHIEDIIHLIKEGRSGDRLYLPKGIRVIKDYSLMVITSEEPRKIESCELQVPGEAVIVGAGLVLKASFVEGAEGFGDGKSSVVLDAESMCFPLKIRPRKPGDWFFPYGFGKRKKLQDFFVDGKVPRDERDSVPLVFSGDDVIWVAGYRADDRFRVTGGTKKFLRLGIVKGKF
jgi:tRNA(Ile)-lysidine synthase